MKIGISFTVALRQLKTCFIKVQYRIFFFFVSTCIVTLFIFCKKKETKRKDLRFIKKEKLLNIIVVV